MAHVGTLNGNYYAIVGYSLKGAWSVGGYVWDYAGGYILGIHIYI